MSELEKQVNKLQNEVDYWKNMARILYVYELNEKISKQSREIKELELTIKWLHQDEM